MLCRNAGRCKRCSVLQGGWKCLPLTEHNPTRCHEFRCTAFLLSAWLCVSSCLCDIFFGEMFFLCLFWWDVFVFVFWTMIAWLGWRRIYIRGIASCLCDSTEITVVWGSLYEVLGYQRVGRRLWPTFRWCWSTSRFVYNNLSAFHRPIITVFRSWSRLLINFINIHVPSWNTWRLSTDPLRKPAPPPAWS